MAHRRSPKEPGQKSPWRYAILVPYLGGISVVTALLTGPVAIVAVPVVDALVLGAFAWDLHIARKEERDAAERAAAEQTKNDASRPPST